MADIDKQALLTHLAKKAEHKNDLIHAVMSGLITAISRGDFDVKEGS